MILHLFFYHAIGRADGDQAMFTRNRYTQKIYSSDIARYSIVCLAGLVEAYKILNLNWTIAESIVVKQSNEPQLTPYRLAVESSYPYGHKKLLTIDIGTDDLLEQGEEPDDELEEGGDDDYDDNDF